MKQGQIIRQEQIRCNICQKTTDHKVKEYTYGTTYTCSVCRSEKYIPKVNK